MSEPVLPPWPDAEQVALAMLTPIAPAVTYTAETVTPPLIHLLRVGGSDDGLTDFPRIEVAAIGGTRQQAWQLAEQCRQHILAAPTRVFNGALVDGARTETPAQQIPDINTDLRRVIATYRLAMRRLYS